HRRTIQHQKNRESEPDINKTYRKAGPIGVAKPGNRPDAKKRKGVVEGTVRWIEQPEPCQRAHCRWNDPWHQKHTPPLPLSLGRNVMNEVRDDEPDQRLEHDRGDRENAGLFNDQPKRLALEQELEVSKSDKTLHRLVERCQMQGVERRIDNQN